MPQALFHGSPEAAIDAKGRTALPADFREAFVLAEDAEMQTRLYLLRRELPNIVPHLVGFGRNMIASLVTELDFCDAARAQQIETILARTETLRFDVAGRFSIGAETVALLGLEDRLLFVGVGRFFEIWQLDQAEETVAPDLSAHRALLRQSARNVQQFLAGEA